MTRKSHQVLQQDERGIATVTTAEGSVLELKRGGPYEVDGATDVLVGDLWVLAGQSNMEGVGDLVGVEEPSPFVHSFQSREQWDVAEEPLHWLFESPRNIHYRIWGAPDAKAPSQPPPREPRLKGAGLGLTFGKQWYSATGSPVGLIPCAHGGTSMEQWSPSLRKLGGDSLFGAACERIQANGGKMRGVLWYQGESDTSPESSALYTGRMEGLVEAFRAETGQPNLPFYFVQLGCFASPTSLAQDQPWNAIREQQRLLPGHVPNSAVVSAIDLELDDAIHIGVEGLKRLGRRLARVATGHPAPSVLNVTLQRDPLAIVVQYANVEGGLSSPGRPNGFSLRRKDGYDENKIYKTILDGDRAVLLISDDTTLAATDLYYGYGFNPYCNIVDGADQSVPAFGPMPVPRS